MTPQGRIDMLEAKRNELVRRKANINTMINELTQVIQPSSIAYDMAAREEVKKTVASLNSELADIQKEEHEVGLKLLRAWKKRDDNDFYGSSSSLWVKRVTS
jgi:septal ring factor EnvC (AmiA/AmiB activator)